MRRIHNHLLQTLKAIDPNSRQGLCISIRAIGNFSSGNITSTLSQYIQDQFPQWYSGDKQYPIADPYHQCPAYVYHANEVHEIAAYQYRRRAILKQLIIDYNLFYVRHNNTLEYNPRKRSSNVERYLPQREYVL